MKKILILIIPFLFFSCKNNDKNSFVKHKDLIFSDIYFLAELGEDNYEELERKIEEKNLTIKHFAFITYVSFLQELNACGNYAANIEIKNDTIKLKTILLSDEVCTSLDIRKLTYIIYNTKKERKIIIE